MSRIGLIRTFSRLFAIATAILFAPVGVAHAIPPLAASGDTTAIGASSATLNAKVNPRGLPTSYYFQYGTTAGFETTLPRQNAGNGTTNLAVRTDIAGLTRATRYFYRVVAENSDGVQRGKTRRFTTKASSSAPGRPTAQTGPATRIGSSAATLKATVNPRGETTLAHFEYGTTTRYGSRTNAISAGSGKSAVAISIPVTGLAANTPIHYRIAASNASGVVRGRDRVFRTARALGTLTVDVSPRPSVWNGRVDVTGQLAGRSASGTTVELLRQDFPFLVAPRVTQTRQVARNRRYRFREGPLFGAVRLQVSTRGAPRITSAVVTVGNRLSVGLRKRSSSRRRMTLSGTINPAAPGVRASVQRRTASGRWVRIKSTAVKAFTGNRSRYALSVPRRRFSYSVRVVVVPNDAGAHGRGISRTLRVPRRP